MMLVIGGGLAFSLLFLVFGFRTNEAEALTLSPVRIEISGDAGQTLSKEMTLINEGNTAETFYPSFTNFESQGESGNPAFVEPKDDLGTWMFTSVPSVTLRAGESKVISFTIVIPKDAEPGGHFAVIFWGTSSGASTGGVSVGSKTGLLVLLSVSGDVKESAGFLNFNTVDHRFFYSTLPVSFEYRFKNDGGDRIKPVGKITIRDTIFLPTEVLDANPENGNILPGSTRKLKVDWISYQRPDDYVPPSGFFGKFWSNVSYQWKNFALGFYSARLNVAYGGLAEQKAKAFAFFFVFPWQLVLVLIVVGMILFFGGRILIKNYNRRIIARAQLNER